MYSVKKFIVELAIESGSPLYAVQLQDLSNGKIYSDSTIFSVVTELSSTTLSDDIELGAVCSQRVSVKITSVSNKNLLGHKFNLYFGLKNHSRITYGSLAKYTFLALKTEKIGNYPGVKKSGIVGDEYIPMGTFTCIKHKKHGGISELELYDRLYFSDDIYKPKVTLPASSKEIEDDICSQLGCKNGNNYSESLYLLDRNSNSLFDKNGNRLKSNSFIFTISSIPEKCTKRQMLSYIAAAGGQFGFIDRSGNYVRKRYGKISEKALDKNTVDEPIISEKANKIIGIICTGQSSAKFTRGTTDKTKGRVLEFENPYMTDSLLSSLFVNIKDFQWYTADLKHRLGDPRFDLGDVVSYENCNIPITNLKFEYSGGLTADISAVGLSEEELV